MNEDKMNLKKIYKLFTENKNFVHFNKQRSNSEYNFFY